MDGYFIHPQGENVLPKPEDVKKLLAVSFIRRLSEYFVSLAKKKREHIDN